MAIAATKLLANTLKILIQDPVEGFTVELVDESNLFEWKVYIEGPKETLYEGGVFQLLMKFPPDYPMSPPDLRFVSDFWHPNVYKDTGVVCISILHPPGEDEMSGESAAERWLPTQTVSTIILSVISLLSAPNFSSPANVDASVEWRNSTDFFKKKIQRLVEKANKEKPSHIVIPHPDTNPEERAKQIAKMKEMNKPITDDDDFMQHEDAHSEQSESEASQEEESDSEGKHSASSEDKKKSKEKSSHNKKNSKKKTQKKKSGRSSKSQSKETNIKKGKEEIEPQVTADSGNRKRKKKNCAIM